MHVIYNMHAVLSAINRVTLSKSLFLLLFSVKDKHVTADNPFFCKLLAAKLSRTDCLLGKKKSKCRC